MGMFDTFIPSEKYASVFVCACGVRCGDLQTKHFDCLLSKITVDENDMLEEHLTSWGDGDEERHRLIRDTVYAHVYTSCRSCQAWNEWRIHIRKGKIEEIARFPEE